ncbi:MAG: prephenate dehydrogenase [Gammaproteobacteria bacterium]
MLIERLAVIGVGLIGGSLARALRAAGTCGYIIGQDIDRDRLEQAHGLGIIDERALDLGTAVTGADAVVVAVPIGAIRTVFAGICPSLPTRTLVTDVSSVKGVVVAAARAMLGAHLPYVVPAHPIAGAEHSGVESSSAQLFAGQRVILTPLPETMRSSTELVQAMWESAGAEVEVMEADRHDELLAATSHLPHALACALVNAVTRISGPEAALRYTAGGFGDLTRIASSSPVLWHDIFLANRERLCAALTCFQVEIESLREAIAGGDGDALQASLCDAKTVRDALAAERRARSRHVPAPPMTIKKEGPR